MAGQRELVQDLGAKLTEAMQDADMTTSQAATATGASREDVLEWLSGTARPTVIQLDVLATTLGRDITEFYQPPDTYRTHSPVSEPAQMRDYVNALEGRRRVAQRELDSLREWYVSNRGTLSALISEDGKAAVKQLIELEQRLDPTSRTVPDEVAQWLGLVAA